MNTWNRFMVAWVLHVRLYIKALVKWLVLAVTVGVLCGGIGSAFHIGVHHAALLRGEYPWLLWCLPALGLAIVGFYKLTKTEGAGKLMMSLMRSVWGRDCLCGCCWQSFWERF